MALKSAQISGLEADPAAMVEALAALRCARPPERWSPSHVAAAVRILSAIFVEKNKGNATLEVDAAVLLADLPGWDLETNDYDHWYWSTLALFQFDGPGGRCWKAWNTRLAPTLLGHQGDRLDGCLEGSWEPDGAGRSDSPQAGGRVHATALNTLDLECYYRYTVSFGEHFSADDGR
jgi:hypothetical protein